MSGRNKISFIKNDEPSFITQMKQRAGFEEGPTVDTKRETPNFDELEDAPDGEDEKPVVVVLKDGDLTSEQAERLQDEITKRDEQKAVEDGKITFKKPEKRSAENSNELNVSSSKKKKETGKQKDKKSGKEVKNKKLLSFDEEDEEEDT